MPRTTEASAADQPDTCSRAWIENFVATHDWSDSPLGPADRWSLCFQHALSLCFSAYYATAIYWGPEFLQFYNEPSARLCGDRHPEAIGRPVRETWHDIWPIVGPQLQEVFETGKTVVSDNFALSRLTHEAAWNDRYFTYAYSAIRDGNEIVGVLEIVVETTDLLRQEQRILALSDERAFLAEASRRLAESLDLRTTLRSVAELVVPAYADWCQIDLRGRSSAIETVAVAHADAELNRLFQRLVGRSHFHLQAPRGVPFTIRTGLSDIIPLVTAEILATSSLEADEIAVYGALGLRSFISVPLNVEGDTLGAMVFAYGTSDRAYSNDDLPMFEEIGRRVAVAVRNARLFEREHKVAESFQEASLPATLPNIPGFTFDAIYQAGRPDGVVGGDWYDALRISDGRVVISIGDVAGSGLQAAITMGNMRQIIRGIAQVHADPALMLDAADRALRLEYPDVFVTAFVAVLDPISRILSYASAGHPPPMLCLPDGKVVLLSDGGLPLGLRHGGTANMSNTIDFALGARLVLYTDGLTEYQRDTLGGEQHLQDVLETQVIFHATNPAARLREVFLNGEETHDDVAVLVVSSTADAGGDPNSRLFQEWRFPVDDAAAAQKARREFCQALVLRGTSPDDAGAAELVFGELIGNVMRYAPGEVHILVDFSTAAPVLHVLDHGPGFRYLPILPSDVFAESGRGLYLICSLTQDFHVAKRPGGGSHARAVLSLARDVLG